MILQLSRKKFTIAEFQQIAETEVFKEEERLELINGEIIEMGKITSKHAAYVDRLNDLFRDILGKKVLVRVQNPIGLSVYSQPQPDIALVSRRDDYYESCHPKRDEIFLLVEIAVNTLESEREFKIPLYAKHQILECWLLDLNTKSLEVYRQPTSSGYQQQFFLTPNDTINLIAFPDVNINVAQITGK